MSEAFSRLHPKIQEAVWNCNWTELRPLQVEAIDAILDSNDHLILAAATATGKTEAAFLPILSQIASESAPSIEVLYVSPLKALINDQFRRLEDLCRYAEIPVHRWHGDVSASDKQRLRQAPAGVLLITPESLESQFINYGSFVPRIYPHLRFVVIDELHAFLESVRGIHLCSLLARLNIAANVAPRRVGLSATIGDFAPAQSFLCRELPAAVHVLLDHTGRKEFRVGLKAFMEAPKAGETDESAAEPESKREGLLAIADDIAMRFATRSNLVFCNSRRQTELVADKLRIVTERESWPRNPFLLHHGSLSRELREDAEQELKSGEAVTVICTSTLELGIDIGAAHAIGQVGPPPSVSSLVQRVGRSGRREDEPQILRLYTLDEAVTEHSSLSKGLFPQLIRSIALIQLHLQNWLELPQGERFHLSTCVHQIFSILRQTGGATAVRLYEMLCEKGAFRRINETEFADLLRDLASNQLVEQIPTGELILAPAAEWIVESRDFYAAFASRIEYSVEHESQRIGVLPKDSLPTPGEFLLLGGRRWRVNLIDDSARRVAVSPAKGWKQPRFGGGVGGLHPMIAYRMKQILSDETGYAFIDATAAELLARARQTFADARLDTCDTVVTLSGIEWFPWHGSNVLRTLELCAKADELIVERDDICLRYQKISAADFMKHRERIANSSFSPADLVQLVQDLQRDRFDQYISDTLLRRAFVSEVLDISGAQTAAAACSVATGSA
jgi:ATP-dependent Lhr-like helicase